MPVNFVTPFFYGNGNRWPIFVRILKNNRLCMILRTLLFAALLPAALGCGRGPAAELPDAGGTFSGFVVAAAETSPGASSTVSRLTPTGAVAWRRQFANDNLQPLRSGGGLVFTVTSQGDSSWFRALRLSDGGEAWSVPSGRGHFTDWTYLRGVVYVAHNNSNNSVLRTYDAASGAVLRQLPTMLGTQGQLAADSSSGLLFLVHLDLAQNAKLYALDAESLATFWTAAMGTYARTPDASVGLSAGNVALMDGQGNIRAFRKFNGAPDWLLRTPVPKWERVYFMGDAVLV
ncbi:MAG: hypothetical protein EOO11_11875, partial [Chitinophagaceae bacterium]